MNKWKIAFLVCLTLLFSIIVFLGAMVINTGVSYTYQQESLDDQIRENEILGNLIVAGAKDYTKKELLHLLRQSNSRAFIVEEDNKIIMDNILFVFENDRLVNVQ